MRKFILVFVILLGSAFGVSAALNESTGPKIVLGGIGAVAGAAIGWALAGIGRRRTLPHAQFSDADALTSLQEEQARHYWLDRGRLTTSPGLPYPNDNEPHGQEP